MDSFDKIFDTQDRSETEDIENIVVKETSGDEDLFETQDMAYDPSLLQESQSGISIPEINIPSSDDPSRYSSDITEYISADADDAQSSVDDGCELDKEDDLLDDPSFLVAANYVPSKADGQDVHGYDAPINTEDDYSEVDIAASPYGYEEPDDNISIVKEKYEKEMVSAMLGSDIMVDELPDSVQDVQRKVYLKLEEMYATPG